MKIGLVVFLALIYSSCFGTLKIIQPQSKNPTGYIFEFNIQQVRESIKKEFLNLPGYRNMWLEFPEKESIFYDRAKDLFSIKGNSNDFYLHYSSSIGKSKIYFDKKGSPRDYYAEFHLHLTAIDSLHTKVEIFTIDPKVVVGRELLPSLPHLVRMDKTKSVPPSTMEEYEILLKIGKGLGVEDKMPKLMIPQ